MGLILCSFEWNTAYMVQCQPSTHVFLRSSKNQPISSGHDVIHTPATFPVWRFIMTIVIVISFARERKTVPNDYAPELSAEKFKAQPNWMIKYNWRKMINIKKKSFLNYITIRGVNSSWLKTILAMNVYMVSQTNFYLYGDTDFFKIYVL